MGRKKKILLLLAASSAVLVLAAVRLVRPVLAAFKSELAEAAAGALGMDVRLGQVGLSPAAGFELSVKGASARKDGVEALGLEELRLKLDPASLLRRKVRISRITLVAPVVFVERHKDGSFNFAGSGRAPSGRTAAIARLVVRRGRLVYTDEGTGRRIEADGLELDLRDFSYGGRSEDWPLKKIAFTGVIACAALKTEGFGAAGLSLRVNAGKGMFSADPFSLTADGVAGGGSLLADFGAAAPAYKLAYVSSQFRIEDLLPKLYHGGSVWRNLRGAAVLHAELTAGGKDAEGIRRSAAGNILLDGKGLRLPAQGGGRDLLTAEAASLTADISVVTRGGNRIKQLSFMKPSVYLVRRDAAGPERAGPPAAAGKPLIIDRLNAAGGSFTYAGEKGARLAASENVDLALKGFSYGGKAGSKTAAKFSFDGEVKCSTFAFGGVISTSVAMGVTAVKGVFSINPLSARLFRGAGLGSLKADLAASPPSYELSYALHQFRLGEFLTAFSGGKAGPGNIKGRAELAVHVTARGNNAGELYRTLGGRVALSGKRMLLPGMDVDELITKYVRSQTFNLLDVGAFLLAGPLGPAVTKSYNFADAGLSRGRNGVILALSSAWTVKDGTAAAEDVALATAKYRLAMQGGLDLADGHFDSVTVAVLDKKGCAAYTQKIHGAFGHPQIGRINMLESLAGPVLGVLETVEKLNPFQKCEVFYSGSVPQPK